jgi:hypothetical protein
MADDVRELLLSTTADADPSTPLSAPDLRLLIDRLRIRSDRLHASALSFASSHRAPLAAALLRAADSSASSSSLESSLASALAPLSSSPGLSDLRELSDRLLAARRELRERQEHLAAASSVADLAARLRAARASPDPLAAAAAAAELKPLLVDPEGSGSSQDEPVAVIGVWARFMSKGGCAVRRCSITSFSLSTLTNSLVVGVRHVWRVGAAARRCQLWPRITATRALQLAGAKIFVDKHRRISRRRTPYLVFLIHLELNSGDNMNFIAQQTHH